LRAEHAQPQSLASFSQMSAVEVTVVAATDEFFKQVAATTQI
jgi:hypothetical protein